MKMAYKIIISANYEIWALHGIIHKQRAGVQRMAEGSEVCMAGTGATGACCWFSKRKGLSPSNRHKLFKMQKERCCLFTIAQQSPNISM